MALFMSLIVPMPFTWKRRLFTFISENKYVAKLQYGLKVGSASCLMHNMALTPAIDHFYIHYDPIRGQRQPRLPCANRACGAWKRGQGTARKFYSQRNMYLCGFTLFLSLILNRTYVMILDVLRLEEENKRLKGDPKANNKQSEKLANADEAGTIGQLKRELEKKDRDIATLKKQAEGLGAEYNKLGDMMNPPEGVPGSSKKSRPTRRQASGMEGVGLEMHAAGDRGCFLLRPLHPRRIKDAATLAGCISLQWYGECAQWCDLLAIAACKSPTIRPVRLPGRPSAKSTAPASTLTLPPTTTLGSSSTLPFPSSPSPPPLLPLHILCEHPFCRYALGLSSSCCFCAPVLTAFRASGTACASPPSLFQVRFLALAPHASQRGHSRSFHPPPPNSPASNFTSSSLLRLARQFIAPPVARSLFASVLDAVRRLLIHHQEPPHPTSNPTIKCCPQRKISHR
ncbi:hypothetical protein FH972_025243 [Carpinus fangiana]|uniref:Endoplasmic reticulum transmembrane protein n=1 Tax=Carpinus fangiana TaxID=176857 RepID=A0A5N6L1F2_9ROSI|nr:hypothetical protein FH972_025243 [Carpinus fangiana]